MKSGTVKRKTDQAPFSNLSVSRNTHESKFKPKFLPMSELNQLHELARRQGKANLVEKIEAEVFRREEDKIEERDKNIE